MSDNKAKRGFPDNVLFNKNENYEVKYRVNQLRGEFPQINAAMIEKALLDSAKVPEFHNSSSMIMNSARLKLRNK